MGERKITTAIILAAGTGSRMRSDTTKQMMRPLGKSVLRHTLEAFDKAELVDSIVVVCREEERDFAEGELAGLATPAAMVTGGATRKESAERGFGAVSSKTDFVAIHDAARCLITPEAIDKVVASALVHGAASATACVNDTIKCTDGEGMIYTTVDRETLRIAQTPQVFSREIYEKAILATRQTEVTDDNMMAELIGVRIDAVNTDCHNFKITTREDLDFAEFILAKRQKNV